MGVMDYSCFLCSDEGEQDLTIWSYGKTIWNEENKEENEKAEKDYDHQLCNYPPQKFEGNGVGSNAYLFLFNENPLNNYNKPEKYIRAKYSWDDWDFSYNNEDLDYREFLLDNVYGCLRCKDSSHDHENNFLSVWYCEKLKKWVVNICDDCYDFFIKCSNNKVPPFLLFKILEKMRWLPFNNQFNEIILSNKITIKINKKIKMLDLTYTDNEFGEILQSLFPLPCPLLRDYIRENVSFLFKPSIASDALDSNKMVGERLDCCAIQSGGCAQSAHHTAYHLFKNSITPTNIKFNILANNPLINILKKGEKDDEKYSPNLAGKFIDNYIVKYATPLQIAFENKNISQIKSLINRGAKLDIPYFNLIVKNPIFHDLIWYFLGTKINRENVINIVYSEKYIESIPKTFFKLEDFKIALQLIEHDISKRQVSKHQVSEGNLEQIGFPMGNLSIEEDKDNIKLFYLLKDIFKNEYKNVEYYDYVCNKNYEFVQFLLHEGFNPQTHFSHFVNINWKEGLLLCLDYGAKRDEKVDYFIKKRNLYEIDEMIKKYENMKV